MPLIIRCHDCSKPYEIKLGQSSAFDADAHRLAGLHRRPAEKYTYDAFREKRGYIRLLNLRGSAVENPLVECELVVEKFVPGQPLEKPYEALSWCWGTAKHTKYVSIRKGGRVYAKKVPHDLFSALKALRYTKEDRFLWIDAICINQEDALEKNHQVEMMSEIYGRAKEVCIWLGEGDRSSQMALSFIRKEVLQLQNFDELCESEQASEKWSALLDLMQRPWFSRRWVVQELALARSAMVYCGNDKISWKKFAVAVELFVEVETATHRLSEVMKKDPKFYHVPGWFEYVSALGASLLVEATGKLFRDYKPNGPAEADAESDNESDSDSYTALGSPTPSELGDNAQQENDTEASSDELSTPNKGHPLLSLEYLVSSLSIFEVTMPHDAVYALLAIAKDTIPSAGDEYIGMVLDQTQETLEGFTQKKRYTVDYQQPFSDICKEFVKFCIEQSESTRALDIICRPWAPEWSQEEKAGGHMLLPSWIPQLNGAAYAMLPQAGVHTLKMGRKNADTLVGLPSSAQSLQRNYNAAETKGVNRKILQFRKRAAMKHHSMYIQGFILDRIVELQPSSQGGAIPGGWARAGGWHDVPDSDPPDEFWRTLVADRGRDGRNPPVYYSRACRESFMKGGLSSGSVNTTDLIQNERCSVVAQFCRRVQAVIWNRRLIKTHGVRLGLASQNTQQDDLICILYGCSVPIVIRRKWKTCQQVEQEVAEDVRFWKENIVKTWREKWKRRRAKRMKRAWLRMKWALWNHGMEVKWQEDLSWQSQWEESLPRKKAAQQSLSPKVLFERLKDGEEEEGYFLRFGQRSETEDQYETRLLRKSFRLWKEDQRQKLGKTNEWDEPKPRLREFQLRLHFYLKWKRKWRESKRIKKLKLELGFLDPDYHAPQTLFPMLSRAVNCLPVVLFFLFSFFFFVSSTGYGGGKKKVWKADFENTDGKAERTDHQSQGYNTSRSYPTSSLGTALDKDRKYRFLKQYVLNHWRNVTTFRSIEEIESHNKKSDPPSSTSASFSRKESIISPDPDLDSQPGETRTPTATAEAAAEEEVDISLVEKFRAKFEATPGGPLQEPQHTIDEHDSEDIQRLKQNWSYYEVLGECYIHGMMDGEAMKYQNEKGIRAQIFELR